MQPTCIVYHLRMKNTRGGNQPSVELQQQLLLIAINLENDELTTKEAVRWFTVVPFVKIILCSSLSYTQLNLSKYACFQHSLVVHYLLDMRLSLLSASMSKAEPLGGAAQDKPVMARQREALHCPLGCCRVGCNPR